LAAGAPARRIAGLPASRIAAIDGRPGSTGAMQHRT
jgi:hypothetical protein